MGWSVQDTANQLQCDHPKFFKHINKGTIQRWLDPETKKGWSNGTKKNIEWHHALACSGQTGILAKYPVIVTEIKDQLQAL
jgi:hypothetical protein